VPHAPCFAFPTTGPKLEGARGGNGLCVFLGLNMPCRLPLLPTADREDCAVDDLSRKTRLPPPALLMVLVGDSEKVAFGPGNAG